MQSSNSSKASKCIIYRQLVVVKNYYYELKISVYNILQIFFIIKTNTLCLQLRNCPDAGKKKCKNLQE